MTFKRVLLIVCLFVVFSSVVSAQISTTDLLHVFQFENNGLNNVTNDTNLIEVGGISYSVGVNGLAAEFDGAADNFLNETPTDMAGYVNGLTLSFWVNASNAASVEYVFLVGDPDGLADASFYSRIDSNDVVFGVYGTGGGAIRTTAGDALIQDGVWYNVVLRWTPSVQFEIWVDGVNRTTTNVFGGIASDMEATPSPDNVTVGVDDDSAQRFAGKLDETYVWNRSLNDSAMLLLNTSFFPFPAPPAFVLNESLESGIQFLQVGSVNVNSPSFSTIFAGSFNITVNDTENYFGVTVPIDAVSSNTATCQLLVNGSSFGSGVSRSNTAGTFGSMYLTTTNLTLDIGVYDVELQCLRTGMGIYRVSGATIIGHLLIDEFNNSVNHENFVVNSSFNSVGFTLLNSLSFNTSDFISDGVHNSTIVVDWDAVYGFNATTQLNTLVSIGSTNCSFYPRNGSNASFGSVGGDCVLSNAGFNNTFNISFFGSGNGNITANVHIKEFIVDSGEVNQIALNGTSITSSAFSLLVNMTIDNSDHVTADIFVKAGVPHSSNSGSTVSNLFLALNNGTRNSSIVSRTTDLNVGVTILEFLFENISTANHSVELWGGCDNSDCTLDGGDLTAYVVNSVTELVTSFNVSAFDVYGNSSVLVFNVTTINGNVFLASVGSVLVDSNLALENLTVRSNGFFPTTIVGHNVSDRLFVNLSQSEITLFALDRVTGFQISNFTVNDSVINGSTRGGNITLNLPSGLVNLSFFNNESYYNLSFVLNISSLDNLSVNISNVHNHRLSFFAISNATGNPVFNFTINISDNNSFGFGEGLTAVGNNVTFNLSTRANYSSFIDALGFAIQFANHNSLSTLNSSFTYNLLSTNSISIRFIRTDSLLLMNGTNVTIVFIGETRQTNITDTGALFVELLVPDEYTLVFSAVAFRQGNYIITVTNRSTQNLTLYLTPENLTSLVLLTVSDRFGSPLEGADITIQRYLNNSWVTEQIVRTDFQGRSEGSFILSTVFYNFLVDFQGQTFFGIPNSDVNKKNIYAEDVSNGINFLIRLLNDSAVIPTISVFGVDVNLSFNDTSGNATNGFFRFFYDDPNNNEHVVCLEVIKGANEVICSCESTTVTSESSVLSCVVNQTSGTAYYRAVGIIDDVPAISLILRLGFDQRLDWGLDGYVLGFLSIVVAFFLFIRVPTLAVFYGTGLLVVLSVFGVLFRDVRFGVWIVLLVLAYLVATLKSDSGVNA